MRAHDAPADPARNGTRPTRVIWEADDRELAWIIQIVTEHEQQYGQVITAVQLRSILQRPGPAD
jgi:hypothetical protein